MLSSYQRRRRGRVLELVVVVDIAVELNKRFEDCEEQQVYIQPIMSTIT